MYAILFGHCQPCAATSSAEEDRSEPGTVSLLQHPEEPRYGGDSHLMRGGFVPMDVGNFA
jgi:hypothetical protein